MLAENRSYTKNSTNMNSTKKLIQEIEKKNPIYLRTNRNCETCGVENELCKVNEERKEENA